MFKEQLLQLSLSCFLLHAPPSVLANVLSERPSEGFMYEEFAFPFELLEGSYVSLKIYSLRIIMDNIS